MKQSLKLGVFKEVLIPFILTNYVLTVFFENTNTTLFRLENVAIVFFSSSE